METNKKTGTQTFKDRKEVGIELRKTHFSLGNDSNLLYIKLDRNYSSQYRQDYPEHKLNGLDGPQMDSVLLRKTHFKLGDYNSTYNTTTMDHNKNIEKGNVQAVANLDINVKNDLRKSHFILGNFEPSYNTIFRQEYYNKSDLKDNSAVNSKTIEKQLRSHNYVLGSDKPDYKSETQAKYTVPIGGQMRNEHKISTHELQKSHYVFGNNYDPWATTSQASYCPKEMQMKKFTKDLTRTNFVFGEDRPDFKSVNQETFVPHKSTRRNEIKELSQDLRSKRHFKKFKNRTSFCVWK
jgi:hypothetical protein